MKKEHLKKLEMPAKKAKGPSAEELDMELDMEDEEGMEDEMEMGIDDLAPLPEAGEAGEALAQISDEELMAEIKKRGLMADLEESPEEDMEEGEMDLGLENEEEDEYQV